MREGAVFVKEKPRIGTDATNPYSSMCMAYVIAVPVSICIGIQCLPAKLVGLI